MKTSRRHFLQTAAVMAAAPALALRAAPAETNRVLLRRVSTLIDTHTHFYDPKRPEGVPWPPKDDAVLYRTVLPQHYKAIAQALPVTGTVVVEASERIEDNKWILDLAARDPFIVGFVGRLPVGDPAFRQHLTRFANQRVFRGLRVRASELQSGLTNARFLSDLRLLVERDLTLDVVGGKEIWPLVPQLAAAVPGLRIVIDHLMGVRIDGKAPAADWREAMAAAAKHPRVFCKVSGLVEGSGQRGKAPVDVDFYRPVLSTVWELFGEDRIFYGSNWPVCEHFAPLPVVQRIAAAWISGYGDRATNRFFWENSQRIYQWVKRPAPRR